MYLVDTKTWLLKLHSNLLQRQIILMGTFGWEKEGLDIAEHQIYSKQIQTRQTWKAF